MSAHHPGPPPEPHSGPPPARPQKVKRFGWLALIIGIVGGLVVGCGAGSAVGGGDAPAAVSTATVTVTQQAASDPEAPATTKKAAEDKKAAEKEAAAKKAAADKEAAEKKAAEKKAAESFGDGTYKVGSEIPAGRYVTKVPADAVLCYWARTKDDSGEFTGIIANENLMPGARGSVTIKAGEFVTFKGGCTWSKA